MSKTSIWKKQHIHVLLFECYYLYKEDDEKIEVGYSSELLEQILGDKIPNRVLKENETIKHFSH